MRSKNTRQMDCRASWTDEELARLRRVYQTATLDELLAAFPNRSYFSIYNRASMLGLLGGMFRETFIDEPTRPMEQLRAEAAARDDGTIHPIIAELIRVERRILQQIEREHYAQLQA